MNDLASLPTPDATGMIAADGRVHGDGLPALSEDQKAVLRNSKATAHKLGGMVVCAAPMAGDAVLLHCYNRLPHGVRLADAIAYVEQAAKASPVTSAGEKPDPIAQAFAATLDLPATSRPAHFLSALSDAGLHGVVAIATITNDALHGLWFQKQEYGQSRDAMRHVLRTALSDAPAELDLELLAQSLGGRRLDLILPEARDKAVALFALDLAPGERSRLAERLTYLAALNPDRPTAARKKGRSKRLFLGGAALAATLYLGMPAPVYVNNFATARAAEANVVALPFGAFLEDVSIRTGQTARPGEVLVRLRAPSLEDSLSEQTIQRRLEEINAQDAIERGAIAEFQLAEKRQELAAIREAQLQERARILEFISDRAARVVSVQSQSDKGVFLPEGTPIITLQTSEGFDVLIDVKPADAARLDPGQGGFVQFRGVSTASYPITVLSAPLQVQAPDFPTPQLQIKARIAAEDQSDLVHGLEGFAKIDTGQAPRIVGLTRPLREYLRVGLWKYLGITF